MKKKNKLHSMRMTVLGWLIFAGLILSACSGGQAPAEITQVAEESAKLATSTQASQAPTNAGKITAAAPQVQESPAQVAAPPGCTVTSPRPTPGPTEESVFPPITSADWVNGPPDAAVTFIEYSDFQ